MPVFFHHRPEAIGENYLKSTLEPEENVLLAPFTTLGIGGPAKYFVTVKSEADVAEAFRFASLHGLRTFVLGGGSNILVADNGFDGLVIHIGIKGIEFNAETDTAKTTNRNKVNIKAAAGENWDEFVALCARRGLAGVECLSGIPGLVGGTPVQNVGAYGQEVSETIVKVRCFDRLTEKIVELSNEDCRFSYRRSIFNTFERDRYIVLAVFFALEVGGEPKIVYPELKAMIETAAHNKQADHDKAGLGSGEAGTFAGFPGHGQRPGTNLDEVRNAVIAIRRRKSMVIDPGDPDSRSVGSFFKNPIVSDKKFAEIAESVKVEVPRFPADNGFVKVPAAWLIENAGFYKGYRMGRVGISTRHSLAIVNLGGAAAAEVIRLKEDIQQAVDRRFGVMLQPEPVFVGFDEVIGAA